MYSNKPKHTRSRSIGTKSRNAKKVARIIIADNPRDLNAEDFKAEDGDLICFMISDLTHVKNISKRLTLYSALINLNTYSDSDSCNIDMYIKYMDKNHLNNIVLICNNNSYVELSIKGICDLYKPNDVIRLGKRK